MLPAGRRTKRKPFCFFYRIHRLLPAFCLRYLPKRQPNHVPKNFSFVLMFQTPRWHPSFCTGLSRECVSSMRLLAYGQNISILTNAYPSGYIYPSPIYFFVVPSGFCFLPFSLIFYTYSLLQKRVVLFLNLYIPYIQNPLLERI